MAAAAVVLDLGSHELKGVSAPVRVFTPSHPGVTDRAPDNRRRHDLRGAVEFSACELSS